MIVASPEGRPDKTGVLLANELAKLDVPVKLLIDSAVAYSMEEVDMVFVGADGVVESGGVINMMGTYQIALVAHSMNKPVYVAAESYKVKHTQNFNVFSMWLQKHYLIHQLLCCFLATAAVCTALPFGSKGLGTGLATY